MAKQERASRLNTTSRSIDSDLAKSLSEKSDRELIDILGNPADWKPEVVDFARSELGRRSISTAQIDQKLAEEKKQKAEELEKKSNEPLTFWESVFAAFNGAVLGLLGLFFVWPRAARFKSNGYILKSKKSWRLYWFGFGVRLTAVVILITISIVKTH
jgi:hypothetical protein